MRSNVGVGCGSGVDVGFGWAVGWTVAVGSEGVGWLQLENKNTKISRMIDSLVFMQVSFVWFNAFAEL